MSGLVYKKDVINLIKGMNVQVQCPQLVAPAIEKILRQTLGIIIDEIGRMDEVLVEEDQEEEPVDIDDIYWTKLIEEIIGSGATRIRR